MKVFTRPKNLQNDKNHFKYGCFIYWVFIKLYHQDGMKEMNSEVCTEGGKEALH